MNAYCTFPKGCGIPQSNMGSRFWKSGWQGVRVGDTYVRHTQMAGNLQCFLLLEIFAKKTLLRRPLQKYACFEAFFASRRPNAPVFTLFRRCWIFFV